MLDDFQLFEKLCKGQPYLAPKILYSYRIVQNPFRKRDTNAVLLLSNLVKNARKGDYRARTWGYTVIRTAYDDDAKFQIALTAIRRAVQAPYEREIARIEEELRPYIENNLWSAYQLTKADRRAEDEVDRRFVNDVLEDRAVLADVTVGQVSDYFRLWALARWKTRRLKSCILLDAVTIEQLQAAGGAVGTASAELYPRLQEFWVTMVEAEPQLRMDPTDVGDDGGARWCDCYRLRLSDIQDFWFETGAGDEDVAQKTREPDPEDNSIRYFNRDYEETLRLAEGASFDWMRLESEPLPQKIPMPRDKRMAIPRLLG
ncbi:hypothetical protein PG984_014803 [Apiospora sp. TS-2023a]